MFTFAIVVAVKVLVSFYAITMTKETNEMDEAYWNACLAK